MKPEEHQEIYRVALETASAELTEISEEFEKLRTRKEQVEKLLTVLRPLVSEAAPSATVETPSAELRGSEEQPQAEPAEVSTVRPAVKEENGQALGVGADPFQRRIDHVLGIGAGIRDVRQYTRQF